MAEQKTGSLAAKMAKVMAEIHRIPKNGFNSFHNYRFATEADVADVVRGLLAQNGVAFLPSVVPGSVERFEIAGNKGSNIVTRLWLQVRFVDGDSGEMMESTWPGEGQDNADKGCYKAITGAEKYALMKTFLIPTGDDPENENDTERGATGRKSEQTQRQASPPPPKQSPPPQAKVEDKPEPPKPNLPPLKANLISPDQVKRLWAVAGDRNWTVDQTKDVIQSAGFSSSKEITTDKYDGIIKVLETELPPVEAGAHAG